MIPGISSELYSSGLGLVEESIMCVLRTLVKLLDQNRQGRSSRITMGAYLVSIAEKLVFSCELLRLSLTLLSVGYVAGVANSS